MQYDEVGNRISQTDANNHTTTGGLLALGREGSRSGDAVELANGLRSCVVSRPRLSLLCFLRLAVMTLLSIPYCQHIVFRAEHYGRVQ
jgi:hypothetical protein